MSTTRLESPQALSATVPVTTHQLDKAPPRILRRMLALDDFEEAARRYIPRPIFGYISGGAETNASMRGNRSAFDDLAFVPKALVDVSGRGQKTVLFGRTYDAVWGGSGGTAKTRTDYLLLDHMYMSGTFLRNKAP